MESFASLLTGDTRKAKQFLSRIAPRNTRIVTSCLNNPSLFANLRQNRSVYPSILHFKKINSNAISDWA